MDTAVENGRGCVGAELQFALVWDWRRGRIRKRKKNEGSRPTEAKERKKKEGELKFRPYTNPKRIQTGGEEKEDELRDNVGGVREGMAHTTFNGAVVS